jgi:hypothetical protein
VHPHERPLEKTPSRRFFCFAVFRRKRSFESAILAGAEKSEIFHGGVSGRTTADAASWGDGMSKKSGTSSLGDDVIPDVIKEPRLSDYLDVMSRAVFQAGLSWAGIGKNWKAYRDAFEGFDPVRVAMYGEDDVERLMATDGVLHSRRKIGATIENARALLEVEREYGGVAKYLRSFDGYNALAKDIKRRFKFMGDMNVWYFLFRTGEAVPQFEHWVTTIPGEHPRMKEMVEKARSAGTSTEY